jgi:hypothetical protein
MAYPNSLVCYCSQQTAVRTCCVSFEFNLETVSLTADVIRPLFFHLRPDALTGFFPPHFRLKLFKNIYNPHACYIYSPPYFLHSSWYKILIEMYFCVSCPTPRCILSRSRCCREPVWKQTFLEHVGPASLSLSSAAPADRCVKPIVWESWTGGHLNTKEATVSLTAYTLMIFGFWKPS